MIRASFIPGVILSLAALQFPPATAAGEPRAGPGGHRVEVSIVSGARAWPETNRWTAEVLAPDGAMLYRIERMVPSDFQYPALTVANDGSGVLLEAAQGRVEFLTPRGEVAAVWTPFVSPVPSYERIVKCSIGDRMAAFLLSEPGEAGVRVVATDLTGRVLRETTLPASSAGEIFASSNDATIVACATIEGDEVRHLTRVLGPDGETRCELPMLFRVAHVDAASGRYAIADRYTVVGGDLEKGAPAHRSEVSAGDRIVTALHCGPRKSLVVTEAVGMESGTPEYRDAEVVILGADGTVLEKTRLQSSSSRPAAVSVNGEEIVVRAGTKTAGFRGVL